MFDDDTKIHTAEPWLSAKCYSHVGRLCSVSPWAVSCDFIDHVSWRHYVRKLFRLLSLFGITTGNARIVEHWYSYVTLNHRLTTVESPMIWDAITTHYTWCHCNNIVNFLNIDPWNMLNSPWSYQCDVDCLMPLVSHHIDTTQTSTVTAHMMCEIPFGIASVCTQKRSPGQQSDQIKSNT